MPKYDSGHTVSDEATPAFWTLTVDETATNDDTASVVGGGVR